MNAMKKIPFHVEIVVSAIPTRRCRYPQERIYEYHDDGRARFEWDRLKQDYILGRDFTIEEVCAGCLLNILLDVEGCKGELYEFETFMRMLPNVKPDSLLLKKNVLNSTYSEEETQDLIDELEMLQESGWNISWPVAQVFMDDEPVAFEESLKFDNLVFYEWSGDDDQMFFTSNNGYHIGAIHEGIVLKKNYGETLPHTFVSLSRRGMRVIGKTLEGDMIPIPMHRAMLPDWWPENPGVDSELRFTSLPISGVFQDIFNMIIIFGKAALQHFTGISIYSRFYRRE